MHVQHVHTWIDLEYMGHVPTIEHSCCRSTSPWQAYTVGGVEWFTQGIGGGLSNLSALCSVGFIGCAATAWLATLVLLIAHNGYRELRPLN